MAWRSYCVVGCVLAVDGGRARYGMVRGYGLIDHTRGAIHRRQQPDGAHKRRFSGILRHAASDQLPVALPCRSGQIPTPAAPSIW